MSSRQNSINKNLLALHLIPSYEGKCVVRDEILSATKFFVVAHKGTSKEEWQNKSFSAFRTDEKELLLFMSAEDAIFFAVRNGLCINGKPMTMQAPKDIVTKMVVEYKESDLIDCVKIYATPPLAMDCSIPEFLGVATPPTSVSPSKIMDLETTVPKRHFVGLDKIKLGLDSFERSERKRVDPSFMCESAHKVIESLIHQNKIDYTALDRELELPDGFIRNFCMNPVSCKASKKALQLMLGYFGLDEYLYVYRNECLELLAELKKHPVIDKYELKKARITTKEPFLLKDIRQGRDEINGAFVYKLDLQSQARPNNVKLVISDPAGCVVGNKYEVVGLAPCGDASKIENETQSDAAKRIATKTAIDEEGKQSVPGEERLIRSDKPGAYTKDSVEELLAIQDKILGYFKKRDALNLDVATERYKELLLDRSVLFSFYKYIESNEISGLMREGYSIRKLIKQLKYPPYEAHVIMMKLDTDTNSTITMLKHKEAEIAGKVKH